MSRLDFEVLLDDPDAGRIVRAGNWVHTLICDQTGRVQVCEWIYDPLGEQYLQNEKSPTKTV